MANASTSSDAIITDRIKASDIICCGDMGASSLLFSCGGKSISMVVHRVLE